LTDPISGVAAGRYLAGLTDELLQYFHLSGPLASGTISFIAASFAIAVTLYFWWQNTKGVAESSEKALQIMKLVTVMVVMLIVWCGYTIAVRHSPLPPWPYPRNLRLTTSALGWLAHSSLPHMFGVLAVLIALGHSVLAMSGEESLAQVYREIESPKLPNLKKAGAVIFVYSLVFTSLVSFFAVMIIPDDVRQHFLENLIGGLAMNLEGPFIIRLIFHGFVVVVGNFILAGAVNTAIVGSNGVLNRVSEDGVLSAWFRQPHKRFGTSYRIINIVVALQVITIIISRGDVTFLANLYAFGVIWSFAMNGLAVLVLRYTSPGQREFQVPLNFTIRGVQIPVGLALITSMLFLIAIVNLFTKPIATMAGATFSVLLYIVFTMAEKRGKSIRLAVVAANDLWDGILRAASSLHSSTIVAGRSTKETNEEQARQIGEAWEKLGDQKPQFNLEIHLPNGDKLYKVLGPHAPNLTANEVNLLHRLWLRFSDAVAPLEMHHHDVVHFALEEVQKRSEERRVGK